MIAKEAKKDAGKQEVWLELEGLGHLSSLLNDPVGANVPSYVPLYLPLELIDEDPNQPRQSNNPGFSKDSLDELASTIRARGVKSPISVRENLEIKGRYLINHGARRYRASKLAGKETIPAFVDNDYNEADQVIENLQRNELTAREISDFIGRELAKGKKKIQIAKDIGKSPSFVTQHVTLLDLPEPIAKVFNGGRINDVTVVNELVMSYKKNPKEVSAWLSDDDQELTRGSVKLLREFLENKRSLKDDDLESGMDDIFIGEMDIDTDTESNAQEADDQVGKKKARAEKIKNAIVLVKHDQRTAHLLTSRRPSMEGCAWLRYNDDGFEAEADLDEVKLIALMEG